MGLTSGWPTCTNTKTLPIVTFLIFTSIRTSVTHYVISKTTHTVSNRDIDIADEDGNIAYLCRHATRVKGNRVPGYSCSRANRR
jgi:hypothetical protein